MAGPCHLRGAWPRSIRICIPAARRTAERPENLAFLLDGGPGETRTVPLKCAPTWIFDGLHLIGIQSSPQFGRSNHSWLPLSLSGGAAGADTSPFSQISATSGGNTIKMGGFPFVRTLVAKDMDVAEG